jgi:hypothetical protein
MSYEKPVVRDYGDVAELTAIAVGGDVADDGVIKSSDVITIGKG